MKTYDVRYDVYTEHRNADEYTEWTIKLFKMFDKVLSKNGCILYNMSYGNENPSQMWLTMAAVIQNTSFMIADTIIWKKSNALPNNMSHNKLTRICEFVFVLCRKNEYKTFNANKSVKSLRPTGQKMYENIQNFIEAKNNDGSCPLNKATYSSELCEKLLKIYAQPNTIVYDPFLGTGTTMVTCKKLNLHCIGSELSDKQCGWAKDRVGI